MFKKTVKPAPGQFAPGFCLRPFVAIHQINLTLILFYHIGM